MTITKSFDMLYARKETAKEIAAFLGDCMSISNAARYPVLCGEEAEKTINYVYHDEQEIRACYTVKLKHIALFHFWWLKSISMTCDKFKATFKASDRKKSGFFLKLVPTDSCVTWCQCLSQVRCGYVMDEKHFT